VTVFYGYIMSSSNPVDGNPPSFMVRVMSSGAELNCKFFWNLLLSSGVRVEGLKVLPVSAED
jgi:hypothetical protein